MFLLKNEEVVQEWVISTSKNQPSTVENSLGTPWGLHRIEEKIGAGEAAGMVFKGRVPQAYCYQEKAEEELSENLITSRILRLRGLEQGVNCGEGIDTWDRYVYIHGTNQESQLGTPFSSGCVLMNNDQIIELYERISVGTYVWIDLD